MGGRNHLLRVCGFSVLLVLASAPGRAPAQTPVGAEPDVRTELKRDKSRGLKHPSLQFLRDNRVFLRAQLDRLSLLTTLTHQGRAELIDERMLRLQELAAAIAAARDTVDTEAAATARRGLLDSVAQLGELEGQLGLMEVLLADQKGRLQVLEADFLGHQETALVVLVRGLPEASAPEGIILSEDNETVQVPLSAAQQASLRQGGVAQISHRLVEPRDHVYTVAFAGAAWSATPAVPVSVTADRDRITFVELDLSRLAPAAAASGLSARVWQR
jgi:hypothetical protein